MFLTLRYRRALLDSDASAEFAALLRRTLVGRPVRKEAR
jgi:hypothetical protein